MTEAQVHQVLELLVDPETSIAIEDVAEMLSAAMDRDPKVHDDALMRIRNVARVYLPGFAG